MEVPDKIFSETVLILKIVKASVPLYRPFGKRVVITLGALERLQELKGKKQSPKRHAKGA